MDEQSIETMSQGLSDFASDLVADGQSDEVAVFHLNAMNKLDVTLSWHLSFSRGRALQAARLNARGGGAENLAAAQAASLERAKANGAATLGAFA